MDKLASLVVEAWHYKISLAPVLLTYLLFEIPAILRKLTKVAYVPIYFIFFPLGHSDQLYAQYFNEDWVIGAGAEMSDEEKRALRRRIQATAIFSMIFSTIVAPWFCGFVSAFYLTPSQFFEFFCFLLIVKGLLIISVLRKLRFDSPAVSVGYSFYCVAALYGAYIILISRGLVKSYQWTHINLDGGGIVALAMGLLDYAYIDLFINIFVVAAGTWALMTYFTDPTHIPPRRNEYEETEFV